MKTLILNGSPRKNGDTVSLIKKLTQQLNGEYKIVDSYYSDISACVDCRYCWNNEGCSINDEMAEIYDYIADCDNVVIASPIYFSQPTGKLLDVCSRFQRYFAAKYFRNEAPIIMLFHIIFTYSQNRRNFLNSPFLFLNLIRHND